MESVLRCDVCGYRHVDGVLLEKKAPVKLRLKVCSPEDMFIRVIRSGNATVEIPELGIKVIPGMASTGYITNVEGILARIEDVLCRINGKKKREKVERLRKKIKEVKEGKREVHLVIEDPTGNSVIISEKVIKDEV